MKASKKETRRQRAIERFVKHCWWSMDTAISAAVSQACDRYLAERHGEPGLIYADLDGHPDAAEISKRCADLTYQTLKELADRASEDFILGDDQAAFLEAYAEAVRRGYFWD